MNIIIPLGGLGTRFSKEGYNKPKPLIKVFEKELLFHLIDNLNYKTEDKFFIIYNKKLDKYNFYEIIKERYKFIELIKLENDTSGASETLMIGLNSIITNHEYNEKCMILDCDLFYTEDVISKFRECNNNAVFYTIKENEKPVFSYINMDDNNIIQEIAEKKKISNNANTGAYCFKNIKDLYDYSKYIVDNKITFNNECYTSCIIHEMINKENIFEGIEIKNNQVFVLGTPTQLNEYINKTYLFLFDLDGTLVITDYIYIKVWNELLNQYNIHVDEDFFKNNIQGNNDMHVINNLNLHNKLDINELSRKKDELFVDNIKSVRLIEGAYDFLRDIKNNGHKIGIVTNCNKKSAEEIINYLNINMLIDKLVIANECKKPKPYPDPYLETIKYFNFNNNKVLIFEDSKSGLLSGKSSNVNNLIGIETIFNNEEMIKMGIDYSMIDYLNKDYKDLIMLGDNYSNLREYIANSLDIDIKSIIIHDGKLKGGYISDVIAISYKDKNNIMNNCVLKLENKNESKLSIMAQKLGLYEREYYFYENISKYVNISIPKFYCLLKDNNFNTIGIILDNMNKYKCEIGIDLNEASIDVSLKIIENMAKLHTKFWNKNLNNIFPDLLKNNDKLFNPIWDNYIKENWPYFIKKWEYLLSEKQIKIGEDIVNNFQNIQNNLSKDNLTLTHGDIKSLNIFYQKDKNYEPCFIDWQYIANGKGVQDLVFFLIESFNINYINSYLPVLKNYYYKKLLENGLNNYSYEEFITDFNNAICYYPFFVGIWFGITPEEDLIDKNFPFFYIQKLFNFIDKNIS